MTVFGRAMRGLWSGAGGSVASCPAPGNAWGNDELYVCRRQLRPEHLHLSERATSNCFRGVAGWDVRAYDEAKMAPVVAKVAISFHRLHNSAMRSFRSM